MNNESGETPEKTEFSLFRSPSLFIKIYATNTLLTRTDSDFRIELFNEKFQTEDGWVYQSDGSVILTREAAKKLLVMLDSEIKAYEKESGEIKISEERMKFQYLI